MLLGKDVRFVRKPHVGPQKSREGQRKPREYGEAKENLPTIVFGGET